MTRDSNLRLQAPVGCLNGVRPDQSRPWTWTESEYADWLACRRWFVTRWGAAGGRELVMLIATDARDEARRAHPDLPIVDLVEATALADAFEHGGLSVIGLGAVLDTKRAFAGELDPSPRPAESLDRQPTRAHSGATNRAWFLEPNQQGSNQT